MDESATPWRALEDHPDPAGGEGPRDGSRRSGTVRPPVAWTAGAIAAAGLLFAIALGLVLSGGHGSISVDGAQPVAAASDEPLGAAGATAGAGADLVVDVQGAVVRPGIVHLAMGSRVADAIAAAGGYGPRVAADRVGLALNLAALVRDGDQVVVPSRDEAGGSSAPGAGGGTANGSGGGGAAGGAGNGPVDLNHATASELDALPGVGPVTVAKIIAAREERPFASLDDLTSRKVLNAATVAKIKDLVILR